MSFWGRIVFLSCPLCPLGHTLDWSVPGYIYCPPVVLSAKQCLPWLRFPHFPVLHGPGSLAWTGVYQALAFCSWDVPLLKSARWLWISEEMAGNQDKDVLQVRPAQKVPVKWRGLSIWRENKLPRHLTEQAHRQEIQADSFSMLRPKRKKEVINPHNIKVGKEKKNQRSLIKALIHLCCKANAETLSWKLTGHSSLYPRGLGAYLQMFGIHV